MQLRKGTQHSYSHYLIPFWNATMRLGIFLLFAFTLSKVKRLVRYPVTFSIGDVTCNITGNVPHQIDKLIKEADELMCEVKGSGKDNIKYKT